MAEYDENDWGVGLRMLAGAVGVARGMQNLEAGEMREENLLLDRMIKMRELEGPSPREKFAFEQGKEQWSRRTEQAKYVINAFTELAKTASEADGKVLEEHASRFMNLLTPQEQEAVGMIWSQSRLNPMNKKGEWFDQTAGGAPKVTADPSKDIYGYAAQMFNLKDYQRRKQGFMTGQVPSEEKLIGLADGLFGYKDSDGKVQVLSSQDLATNQIAKENGINPGELVANGGMVYGKDREISIGGNLFRTRSVYNAIENKRMPSEIVPVREGGKALGVGEERLKDFSVAFTNKDDSGKTDGSKDYLQLNAWLDSKMSLQEVTKRLSYKFPGYNFAFIDPGTFSNWPIWGGYSPSDTQTLVYWRGEQVGVPTKDGEMLGYYYDHPTGRVYDPMGRVVANDLVSWQNYIGSMTKDEIVNKSKGASNAPASGPAVPTAKPSRVSGEVKIPSEDEKADLQREAAFNAQTEKIKANINAALEALSKLGTGRGIPRVR